MSNKRTQFYSVYGQCEAAAADALVAAGKATKIAVDMIPYSQRVNDQGASALFAVCVPGHHVREFENLCAVLRA